jgi:hypothetical protein
MKHSALGETIFSTEEEVPKRYRRNVVLGSDDGVDHVDPHRHALPGILPGSVAGDAQGQPFSLKPGEARAICRSRHLGFRRFAGLRRTEIRNHLVRP